METLLLVLHVLVGIGLVGLVLLQHGKGADMGAAFGSGSSGSLFGASGSANFLSRATAILATVFFLSSLGLTYLATHRSESRGVMERVKDAPPATGKPVDSVPQAPASSIPVPAAPAEGGPRAGEVPK